MCLLALLRQSARMTPRSYTRCNIHCSTRILTPHSGVSHSAFGATRLMTGLHRHNSDKLFVELPSICSYFKLLRTNTSKTILLHFPVITTAPGYHCEDTNGPTLLLGPIQGAVQNRTTSTAVSPPSHQNHCQLSWPACAETLTMHKLSPRLRCIEETPGFEGTLLREVCASIRGVEIERWLVWSAVSPY